jgi:hypothetical protein
MTTLQRAATSVKKKRNKHDDTVRHKHNTQQIKIKYDSVASTPARETWTVADKIKEMEEIQRGRRRTGKQMKHSVVR